MAVAQSLSGLPPSNSRSTSTSFSCNALHTTSLKMICDDSLSRADAGQLTHHAQQRRGHRHHTRRMVILAGWLAHRAA